jgi:hypothetical protein
LCHLDWLIVSVPRPYRPILDSGRHVFTRDTALKSE